VPLVIATLLLAVVLGLWAPRRVAIGGTLAAATGTVLTFAWVVADGRGADPWWIVPLAVAGGAMALAVTGALLRVRAGRAGGRGGSPG
jgi:hypothetical protein